MCKFFGGKFKWWNPVKFKSSLPKIKRSVKYLTFVLLCFGIWWVNLSVAFAFHHYENHPSKHAMIFFAQSQFTHYEMQDFALKHADLEQNGLKSSTWIK